MQDEPETIGAAIADAANAVEAAAEIATSETAETVAAVIEHAAERVEEAQEAAERIAQAAMETELGRQIGAVNERVTQWLDGPARDLQFQVTTLTEQVANLSQQLAATAGVTLATALEVSSSTPPTSGEIPTEPTRVEEAVQQVASILPETLEVTAPAENTPAAPTRRVKRFL